MNKRRDDALIEEYMDCLEPNDCYANALFIGRAETMHIDRKRNVALVLGVLGNKEGSCPHAWLEIDGVEADPTAVFFQEEDYVYDLRITIPIDEALTIGTARISQLWNHEIDPRKHEEYIWEVS